MVPWFQSYISTGTTDEHMLECQGWQQAIFARRRTGPNRVHRHDEGYVSGHVCSDLDVHCREHGKGLFHPVHDAFQDRGFAIGFVSAAYSKGAFDGKTLYFSKLSGRGIWATPASGGVLEQVTGALHFGYWGEFGVTENGLYLVNSDPVPGPVLMYYSYRTRQLKPILNLSGPPKAVPWSANLGASRDGRAVLVVPGTFRSSLVM